MAKDILKGSQSDIDRAIKRLANRAMGAGMADPDPKAGDELLELFNEAERASDGRVIKAMTRPGVGPVLFWAAGEGHLGVVKALIVAGADPKLTLMANIRPINEAARKGHAEVITALVGAGEDPNYAGFFNKPVPVAAAEAGQLEAVKTLLRLGADVKAKDGSSGKTILIAAAPYADAEVVRLAVQKGADVNLADDKGRTALMQAAEAGKLEAVQELIRLGADVNAVSRLRPLDQIEAEGRSDPVFSRGLLKRMRALQKEPQETALILAAKAGHAEVVAALLSAGADANARDNEGRTAYDWASRLGHKAAAAALRGDASEMASSVGDLLRAAEEGNIQAVKAAIAAGADVNAKDPVAYDGPMEATRVLGGKSALLIAAGRGDVAMVNELIALGADVNAYGDKTIFDHGQTPLQAAAEAGHVDVVRALIAAGANVNAKESASAGNRGSTALQLAIEQGHQDVVDELIKARAKHKGAAPSGLHEAAGAGQEETLRKLLAGGADVNQVSKKDNWTPLMHAAFMGRTSTVRMLLDAGADVNLEPKSGQTALTVAVHGAWGASDIDDEDRATRSYTRTVSLLIERGADVNVNSWTGGAPLDMAEEDELRSIVKILKQAGAKRSSEMQDAEAQEVTWAPPDLSKAEKAEPFRRAVREFTKRLGKARKHEGECEAGAFFKTTHGEAKQIVEKEQAKWLKEGVFVFRTAYSALHDDDEPEWVGLMATADKYDVIAAMQTAGGSEPGTRAVIAGLKDIENSDPFVLWFISEDTLEGEFLKDVKIPGRVAKQLYEICSDIVDQGTGSTAVLAKTLRKGRRLFLWWD